VELTCREQKRVRDNVNGWRFRRQHPNRSILVDFELPRSEAIRRSRWRQNIENFPKDRDEIRRGGEGVDASKRKGRILRLWNVDI